MHQASRIRSIACVCLTTLFVLAGCGGGGGGSAGASFNGSRGGGALTVGGTVTGLGANEAVTLVNNGGDPIAITANGSFTFASAVASGGTYAVTVQSHTPGVACAVSNGSGTVGSSAVTEVAVACGAGTGRVLYALGVGTDGQYPTSTLVADGNGNFYGTTQGGGTFGQGTVFKITPTGAHSVVYHFAGGTTDGERPQAGLVIDSAGNLYGTTYAGGGAAGFGTVFKISPAGNVLWRHSFSSVAGDGKSPVGGLVMDASGDLYGTTSSGGVGGFGTVFKVTQGGTLTTLYSFADPLVDPNDGQTPNGTLLVDSAGNLYGTTTGGGVNNGGTIFKMTTGGSRTWLYSLDSTLGEGLVPTAGLVMDSAGNFFGTTSSGGMYGDGTVFKVTAAGVLTVVYAFNSTVGDGKTPYAELVLDGFGSLYGTCSAGGVNTFGTVFKVTQSGTHTVLYSFGGNPNDGRGPSGGLYIDSVGNIYGTTSTDGINYGSLNDGGTIFKID